MTVLSEPACPMSRNDENNKTRYNPLNREIAFSVAMHDVTTDMYRLAHAHDEGESFSHALAILEAHIASYKLSNAGKVLPHIDVERVLVNSHPHVKKSYPKGTPLWAFVRDMTGVGSTSANLLCSLLGWNPDSDVRRVRLEWKGKLK